MRFILPTGELVNVINVWSKDLKGNQQFGSILRLNRKKLYSVKKKFI